MTNPLSLNHDEIEREISEAEEFFQCRVDQGSREHIKFLIEVGDAKPRHLVGMWKLGMIDGKLQSLKGQINALSTGSSRPVAGITAGLTATGGTNGNHSERG